MNKKKLKKNLLSELSKRKVRSGVIVTIGFAILFRLPFIKSRIRNRRKRCKKYIWINTVYTGLLIRQTTKMFLIKCFNRIEGFTLRVSIYAFNVTFFKVWSIQQTRKIYFAENIYQKILRQLNMK